MSTKYFALRKCSIDGKRFDAGSPIEGVSPDRCKKLIGRIVETEDMREDRLAAIKAAADTEPEGEGDIDIDKMTVPELEAFAEDLGIDLPDGNKAEKLAAIKAATDTE